MSFFESNIIGNIRQRAFVLCLMLFFVGMIGGTKAYAHNALASDDEKVTAAKAQSVVETARADRAAVSDTASATDTAKADDEKFNFARIFSNTAGGAHRKPPRVPFVIGPGVYYTPSTSLAFNLGCQMFFDGMDKHYTRPELLETQPELMQARRSNLTISLSATILNQYEIKLKPEFYFLDRNLMVKGVLYAAYWPNWFWGIGDHTPESNIEPYNQIINTVDLRVVYNVVHGLFLGVGGGYFLYDILSKSPAAGKASIIPDKKLALGAGPMFSMVYDTRNDNTRPLKGSLISFDAFYNAPVDVYSRAFGKFSLDVRHYFHFAQKKQNIDHVLALNFMAVSTMGNEIPFQELPGMAHRNETTARGLMLNRYIDRHMMIFQAEYRVYWKWLGAAVFGAVGDVGNTLKAATDFNKITYGGGLRVKPFSKLPFSLRADVGFFNSEKKPRFYVGMNECF